MTKRTLLALPLALAGLAFGAACGSASDGISDAVGPNPISDGRSVVHRATNNGWSSAESNRLADELVSEVGLTETQADCVRDFVMDTWTPSEWMATTGNEPEIASMVRKCA